MNSNNFSWQRFGKVVRHDLGTLPSQYGVILLVLTLLPTAVWLLVMTFNGLQPTSVPPLVRRVLLAVTVQLAACLTPARLYRTCNMPHEGIYFAMLPASKLEKFLSVLLFTLVICPLMVLCGTLAVDTLLTLLPFGPFHESIFSMSLPGSLDMDPYTGMATLRMLQLVTLVAIVILGTIELSSIFLLGATFFKKYKFLKTLLALWVLRFVSSLVLIPIIIALTVHGGGWIENMLAPWEEADNLFDLYQYFVNIALVVTVAIDALLIWWSSRRMKRMAY